MAKIARLSLMQCKFYSKIYGLWSIDHRLEYYFAREVIILLLIFWFPKLKNVAFGIENMDELAIIIFRNLINNGHVLLF